MNIDRTDEGYNDFFDKHSSAVMHYALRRLDNFESCEDVVVDTFFVAWKKWDERPPADRELPWLLGIAFRVLSNSRTSRDRRARLSSLLSMQRDADVNDCPISIDSDVDWAMGLLSTNDREVLRLAYWEHMSYRDIAQAFGINENAAGIRISRAKTKLRGHLLQAGERPRS